MHRALLAVLITTGITAPLAAEEWTKNFAVSGTPELRVQTNDARIEVTSWQRNQIAARVVTEGWRIADDKVRVRETQTGDRVALEVHIPNFDWKMFQDNRRSARIEVSVPAKASLDLRTGDGGVSLASVEGTIRVHTGDGSIGAENLRGHVWLSSGDGRIEARRLAGTVRVSTGDGTIDVRDLEGEVELSTGDGRIDAIGMQAALRARTNDGRVNVDGRFNRLSIVTMLVNTNDAFTGLDSLRLRGRGETRSTMAYDGGSEKNNELKSHIPGPCCGSAFVRDPEGALIRPHDGITGVGQLTQALYDWDGPAARIAIERVS